MKNLKLLPFIILLFCAVMNVSAKDEALLDTVQYNMDNNLSMTIIAVNFHNLSQFGKCHSGSIDSLYASFLADLLHLDQGEINDKKANNLTYIFDGLYSKIRINNPAVMENEVSFDEKGNKLFLQRVEFEINEKERLIFESPTLEGFDQIGKMKLDELISASDTIISPKGRRQKKHKMATIDVENGSIQPFPKTLVYPRPNDMIELGLGVGLGSVGNILTPDFEVGAIVRLSQKGQVINQFGASYSFLFFFQPDENDEQEIKTDGFVNLYYFRKKSGIKLGVMVDHNSNAFKKDAYKLSGIHRLHRVLSIEGGFYIHNEFKEVFPYIRLAFSLF